MVVEYQGLPKLIETQTIQGFTVPPTPLQTHTSQCMGALQAPTQEAAPCSPSEHL